MNLFTDHAKPGTQNTNKARIDFLIDEKITKQLSQFSEQQKVTLSVTLLSAYKVLLYRYSSQEDICVGNATLSSEYNKKTEYFVDVLALCTAVNGNDSFEKLLQRVNSTLVNTFSHQKALFENVVDREQNDLERSMSPLYQVMFIFQNGLEFPDELLRRHTSKSDLTFILKQRSLALQGTVEYSADLYQEDTIVHIIDHYKLLLNSIIANPQKSIGTLSIFETDEHKLLKELNNTAFKDPKNKSLMAEALDIASSADTEKRLAKIWAEVLGISEETINITSDFFDIGGNSIKAIRLRGLIHKELGVKLTLKELFSENTIDRQAKTIDNKELNAYLAKELVPEQPDYELSSAQRRLWVLNQFDATENAYNIPYVIVLKGHLDKAALKNAFIAMISRHEILRTVFKEDKEGNPRQQIINAGAYTFKLEETDLRNTANQQFILNNLVDQQTSGSFNLSEGPLLRCHLAQLEEDRYVLVMVHHHILSDGWSMDVFRKEWCAFYNACLEGNDPKLPLLKIQYKDYAAWHNHQLESDDIILHKDYWLKQFEGEIPILELPADKERPAIKTFNGASLTATIDHQVLEQLNKTGKALGGTLFMSLLACVNALLYRYTGQQDIVIGSPIAGREHPDLEDQIGFYINTLALRTRFNGAESYEHLFQQIREVTLSAYEHQLYPYDELVDALKLPRNINRNPLFDVMVVLQNSMDQDAEFTLNGLQTSVYDKGEHRIAKFDINFIFSESKKGLDLFLEYNTDIYSTEQINRMLKHFENIMASVVGDPKQSLAGIDFLTKKEKQQLLQGLNNTAAEYPKDKTMVDLFEEQVKRTPGNIAVIFEDTELSYQELNILSNQFGDYLRKTYQVKPDDLVGIKLERSQWMIVTILAILKAGGAYVPIAPDYPQERINYLLRDSACKVLIDEQELEKFKRVRNKYNQKNQRAGLQPHHLAYCIYTSGSTGNPKGCLLQHTGLVNRLEWMQKAYPLTANDVILQKTTFSFDVSVWELLWWAIQGASVCMLQPGGEKSPEVIIDTVEKYKATVIHFVPSMLSVFLEYLENDKAKLDQLKGLKQVFTSGEALTLSQAERFNELFPNTSLMNLYGPTEASIDVTYFDCKKETLKGIVPIGKPIDNTQIYILDKFRKLLPVGAAGEICIGGVGLARGYLKRPELTAEKFIENPFIKGERIYRTGDLGRWRPDGNIEYLGRIDDQVKIRGFRIELDEISSVLEKHSKVKDAVVIARAINGQDKELIAYTTGKAEAAELREYLKEQLPAYMIPGYYVHLETIPLTGNGKANRKALPLPDSSGIRDAAYVAPSTDIEKALVKIWSEVLGRPKETISVKSDFFDMGGHSIKAIRLLGLIHKELGVKLLLKELFSESRIEQQAVAIANKELKIYEIIEVIQEQPDYKLSSAQRRLWILNHFEGAQSAYNIPYIILLEGHLNKAALKKAFKAMASRHEILRTVFKEDKTGTPRQHIISAEAYPFKLKETDLRGTAKRESILNQLVNQESFDSFDFIEGPLWRCHLVQLEEDRYVLMMVHHHIISDGWSMDVFRKEWCAFYNACLEGNDPKLPLLKIQYKDYAAWHNHQLE
ncbi:MAG: Long-chain-fatty-acid--CoA ligase, partial [Mucilaginibacter sp.]|nr:Long-chain-fatty-acid--CoA ligase [Mucilaginibacter sp.]